MIFRNAGIKVSQERLAREIGREKIFRRGTRIKELLAMFRKYGFQVQARNNHTLSNLQTALRAGKIVVVCFTEPVWEWGHYSLVRKIGKKKVFFIDPDVAEGKRSLSIEEFKRRWRDPLHTKTVRWAAIVEKKPQSKK